MTSTGCSTPLMTHLRYAISMDACPVCGWVSAEYDPALKQCMECRMNEMEKDLNTAARLNAALWDEVLRLGGDPSEVTRGASK